YLYDLSSIQPNQGNSRRASSTSASSLNCFCPPVSGGLFFRVRTREVQSEQLSVPKGGFGKFHSKRLPESVMQVRVCGALGASAVAGAGGGAKVRADQGEVTAA